MLRERGSGTLDILLAALQKHNIKLSDLNVKMYLGSTESIKLFLENCDCLGILSIRSVNKELYAGEMKVLEIKDYLCFGNLTLCSCRDRKTDCRLYLCSLPNIIKKSYNL